MRLTYGVVNDFRRLNAVFPDCAVSPSGTALANRSARRARHGPDRIPDCSRDLRARHRGGLLGDGLLGTRASGHHQPRPLGALRGDCRAAATARDGVAWSRSADTSVALGR